MASLSLLLDDFPLHLAFVFGLIVALSSSFFSSSSSSSFSSTAELVASVLSFSDPSLDSSELDSFPVLPSI